MKRKGMSNIYLKFTIEKNWRSQNFHFNFQKFISRSVFGKLQLTQILLNFKTSWCNLKTVCFCVAFLLFWFWEELWRIKVGLSTSKRRFVLIFFYDIPSKMMKNAFYFILKAIFVLKIFKFLSWLFGHVKKTAQLER